MILRNNQVMHIFTVKFIIIKTNSLLLKPCFKQEQMVFIQFIKPEKNLSLQLTNGNENTNYLMKM